MRPVLIIALVAVLGVGVWALLGGFDQPQTDDTDESTDVSETAEEAAEREREMARFGLKTGTLAVQVRTVDGKRPLLAEVGYLQPNGKPRWLVAQEGRRVITDAPLGSLTCVARAPGYGMAKQGCEVVQGVRADVILVLSPETGAPKDGDPGSSAPKDG